MAINNRDGGQRVKDDLDEVFNSFINGQFKQMVRQIDSFKGIENFIVYHIDSLDYLTDAEKIRLIRLYIINKGDF